MVDMETQVVLTMKTVISAVLSTIAAIIVVGGAVLWAVLSFTIGGMRDDVSAIRASNQTLQVADKDSAVHLRETENKLIEQIGGLRVNIAELSGKLGAVSGSMTGLSGRIDDLQKQVVARQSSWERWDDPKAANTFIANVKKAGGLEDGKIILVPFGPEAAPSNVPK